MEIRLRSDQKTILAYTGGKMGISAVPGSGKTWTLSLLAAQIIASGNLAENQEVLVVTLVNSAVDNFYQRVSNFVQSGNLVPTLGYRVRTLHGLAHDIVRERPELVGLDNNFQIVDEREADSILDASIQAWMRANPTMLDDYMDAEMDENRRDWVRREHLPELVRDIAGNFIRYAKDLQLTDGRLKARLEKLPLPMPLLEMSAAIYSDYQRSLAYRGAVDFDDLIRMALDILETDEALLERLRMRWPYILEDEAQDSSRLQEKILSLLAGPQGNWVRVGDPNQAIYETFTTANPRYLREFLQRTDVISCKLPNSGRSTQSIIDLANHLAAWTQTSHPEPAARDALQVKPLIEPAPPGDPQPNPPDELSLVRLEMRRFTPYEEIQAVANSLERWLPNHHDETVAVLAPRNQRAFELVDELRKRKLEYTDGLLRSSSTTRFSAGALGNILRYLSDPQSASKLATVFKVWRRGDRSDEDASHLVEQVSEMIKRCRRVEDYLWPGADYDWLEEMNLSSESPQAYELLAQFRLLARRWQGSVLLPVDQIVLTLAQDLLSSPAELAVAHKLAVLLRNAADLHPSWHLPELSEELAVIARNERRFLGFSDEDSGFDPEKYKGKVVVSTIHKAKGLEWDRVYLMSVNNYDFPAGQAHDTYIAEKWFIRDKLNLEAEALAQLDALMQSDPYSWYAEGQATLAARLDYVRERLRLLYVGITRARRELLITWNTGRRGTTLEAAALADLYSFWQSRQKEQKGGEQDAD